MKLSLIWRKTRIETIQSLRLNENFPFYPFKNIPKRSKTKTYETDSESFRLSKEEKYSNKEMSFIVCQNLKIFEKINKFPFKYKQNNIEKPFFLQDISYSIKNKNLKTSPKTSVNYSLDFIKRRMTETKIKDNSNLNLNFQRNTSFSNILNNKTKRYVDCHRPSTHQSGSGKKKLQNFLKAIKT